MKKTLLMILCILCFATAGIISMYISELAFPNNIYKAFIFSVIPIILIYIGQSIKIE